MGSSEKFCLKWNDFTANITSSLNQIKNDPEFSDVTLVCGGDQKYEAHKVILASSSRLFRNILKQNKHPHPLIYMTGVNTNQISAVMDFIYHGEVNIFQEDLDAFLILAEELEIKGLGSFDAETNMPDRTPAYNIPPKRTNSKFQQIYEMKEKNSVLGELVKKPNEHIDTIHAENALVPVDTFALKTNTNNEEFIKTLESMMKCLGQGKYACKVCGKNANYKTNMINHVEANHIEGTSYPCNKCGKVFRSGNALSVHVSRNHKS